MKRESPIAVAEAQTVRTSLSGHELLWNPRLNKGTAFTEAERDAFGLHGLLPPQVRTLDIQVQRRKQALDSLTSPFAKYDFMRELQDSNETLFYAFIAHYIEEVLPIVYTPEVGEGCERFSEVWRKPRGLFLSYPNMHRLEQILSDPLYDDIRCIVVTDGERILGLGDQGAGGMGIPIGKMALYTALGGIPPEHCLPITLDVGTDNEDLLNSPVYVGWHHRRIRGSDYEDFVEAFMCAVESRWPHVLLQWEDFAGPNAQRLLDRYRNRLCTFNDDIQGTAAVVTATLLSAVAATGIGLKDLATVIYGFGAAGTGIADMLLAAMKEEGLTDAQARKRIYGVGRHGLIVEGGYGVRESQLPFARKPAEVAGWRVSSPGNISLLDVVRNAQPTALIGVSCQPGAFTEDVAREMARNVARPIIFPLSNPTSRCEATPKDLLAWTEGRALVGTGSPFKPVELARRTIPIAQTNNSYIFPGLALGILVSRASRVTDNMFMAAAKALATLSPALREQDAPLLPRISDSRKVSMVVAEAVARQAKADGVADRISDSALREKLRAYVWEPVYLPYEHIAPR
ncbi:MAG TPA: NAD-dependent malic enzyme [Terracidiphilus sp.]|nr:NAD-dependent malic enzyme [Terracidiphilus sp.]